MTGFEHRQRRRLIQHHPVIGLRRILCCQLQHFRTRPRRRTGQRRHERRRHGRTQREPPFKHAVFLVRRAAQFSQRLTVDVGVGHCDPVPRLRNSVARHRRLTRLQDGRVTRVPRRPVEHRRRRGQRQPQYGKVSARQDPIHLAPILLRQRHAAPRLRRQSAGHGQIHRRQNRAPRVTKMAVDGEHEHGAQVIRVRRHCPPDRRISSSRRAAIWSTLA